MKIPKESESPAIYVDIFKSYNEINHLINDCVLVKRIALPRKKARFDYVTYRRPKEPSYPSRALKKQKHETSNPKS